MHKALWTLINFIIFFSVAGIAQNKTLENSQMLQYQIQNYLQNLNADPCEVTLIDMQQGLDSIQWDDYPNEVLLKESPSLIFGLFQLRLALHQKLPTFSAQCAAKARIIFHQLRNHEDFLGSFAYLVQDLDPLKLDFQTQPVPILNREAYPKYLAKAELIAAPFQFQNGDVMIARGVSFFSAIITQISDNQSHFSHTLVVHKSNDEIQTIESYVGKGMGAYELDFALKNENVRLMVLRPKDSALAEKAATVAMDAAAKKLPYDYEMNFDDDQQMSCVEVPTYAYKIASDGTLKIPKYPAQLNLKNEDFLMRLGLKNGELITPDDLETDPRFELVLDWKDARLVRDSRQKDAVLFEIIRRVNDENYKFQPTIKSFFVTQVLLPLRQTFLWNLIKNISGVPQIDAHIPPLTLEVMTQLDQVATKLLSELKKQDDAYQATKGRVMTNMQLREVVKNLKI